MQLSYKAAWAEYITVDGTERPQRTSNIKISNIYLHFSGHKLQNHEGCSLIGSLYAHITVLVSVEHYDATNFSEQDSFTGLKTNSE